MNHESILKTPLKPIFNTYNKVLGGPSNSLRPSQLQFMITCYEGVANNRPVIIEGPTGLGKTKALLAVATAYLDTNPDAQVLYTTRTMPQLQNIDRDLGDLTSLSVLEIHSHHKSLFFSVYIGIGSIRRLFCSRYLQNITMDPEELKSFRALLDDPDRPEPCPDCNIRETRLRNINNDNLNLYTKFGLEEMESSIKQNLCPVPEMRACASHASVVLTTYPYLMSDFWKATVLGHAEQRKKCLPLIDEAHNILEIITESPGLTINLTRELEPGQGLDLSNNVYFLASLVDDIKYGYKKVVLGHLNILFQKAAKEKNHKKQDLFNKQSNLHTLHKQKCDHAKSLNAAYGTLVKSVKEIRMGCSVHLNNSGLPSSDIDRSAEYFSSARSLATERDELVREGQTLKKRHSNLCGYNSDLKRQRNDHQEIAKSYQSSMHSSTGPLRDVYYNSMKDSYGKADQAHSSMVGNNQEIKLLGSRIDHIKKRINEKDKAQKEAYSIGKYLLDSVFTDLKSKKQDNSKQIDDLNNKINSIQKEIDQCLAELKSLDQSWGRLMQGIENGKALDQSLDTFYKDLYISERDREKWPTEMIDDSFALFEYIVRFRTIFESILSPLETGVLGEAKLGEILRQLNSRLAREAGEDISQFLDRCEKAVSEFEQHMLRTEDHWNGLPLYALCQMFRILSLICQGPYGFAGMLDRDGRAPKIVFHSLDPAVRFKDAWHDLKPPILASATLSPVSDVANVLGLNHGIKAKIEPVFPKENYLSFAFIGCHSSLSQSNKEIFNNLEKKILQKSITSILSATRCHTGLFCASHNVLNEVLKLFPRKIFSDLGMHLMVARSDKVKPDDDFSKLKNHIPLSLLKGMSEFDARLKLYMELAGKMPIVIAGVTGGGLGEGVDYRGKAMELAMIIGIPYQDEGDRSWLNQRRTAFFKMRTGKLEIGKDLAYRQSALRKVAQTAGRVHRTMKDKGSVIFFDERLLGIKNTASSGPGRYEVLSAPNTKRHWDIIQTRILERLQIVAPSDILDDEAKDLSKYVDRVFKSAGSKPEMVDFNNMLNQLRTFYSEE